MWAFPPGGAPRLKVGYFTSSDQGMIAATLELPEGKSLQETDAALRKIENRLAAVPELKTMFASTGHIQGGGRSSPEAGAAQLQQRVRQGGGGAGAEGSADCGRDGGDVR